MIDINQLHGEIWYQVAYTMALLEGDKQKSKEIYKELSDKIHEILVSRVELPVGMPSETLSCELKGRIKELKRFEKVFDLCKPEDGCIECDSRREIIRRRIISIEQKIEELKASKP